MKKYMTLGLVGLLGCNGSDDSGRLEGSGEFFEDDSPLYLMDIEGSTSYFFENGLSKDGIIGILDSDVGEESGRENCGTYEKESNNSGKASYNNCNQSEPHLDEEETHQLFPYSESVNLIESSNYYNIDNNEECNEGGNFGEALQNLITDCSDRILVMSNNSEFIFTVDYSLEDLGDWKETEDFSYHPCSRYNYCTFWFDN